VIGCTLTVSDSAIKEQILRGEIYLVNLEPVIGKETGKARPAVILQNNIGNKYSPVTIIAPVTSVKEISKPLPIMVFIPKGEGGLTEDSFVDCGQIRTIDKHKRLMKKFGSLNESRLKEIDKAIKISLSID
jgi:mRNA interferase MazF